MASYKHRVKNNNSTLKRLTKESGIDPDLAQGILWFVRCLVKPGMSCVDPQIFSVVMSSFMGISDQNSIEKVFERLSGHSTRGLSVEQFSNVLCMFYADSLDMQIDHVFHIYDANNDGQIDVSEVAAFIKTCKCVTDIDDAEKDETFTDLCAMVFECLGITTNEGITLETFRAKVKNNALILAMLGQHLPSQHFLESFKNKIVGKTSLQIKEAFGNIRFDLLFEPPDTSRPKFYPIELDLP